MPAKPGPPSGYLGVEIHAQTAAEVAALGSAEWRKPIHGTACLVAPDGSVLAHVRTLGSQLPVKDRRYGLRVKGVTFTRIVPMISPTKPIRSDIAAYDTMAEARAAGSELIRQMVQAG